MIEERRNHIRFPVMRNVGEPIELQVIQDHGKISIPGFILNLSAGGMGIITLGNKPAELSLGEKFILDLRLPNLVSLNVEGKIVRISRGKKAQLHHSNNEWFLGLKFTKIKRSHIEKINHMAEEWNICETKIQLNLPDVCFRECAYWDLCEKPVKLTAKQSS